MRRTVLLLLASLASCVDGTPVTPELCTVEIRPDTTATIQLDSLKLAHCLVYEIKTTVKKLP